MTDFAALLDSVYKTGYKHGLEAYAHMKDGVYYVGTTGRTLRDAIRDMENTYNYMPPSKDKYISDSCSKVDDILS